MALLYLYMCLASATHNFNPLKLSNSIANLAQLNKSSFLCTKFEFDVKLVFPFFYATIIAKTDRRYAFIVGNGRDFSEVGASHFLM